MRKSKSIPFLILVLTLAGAAGSTAAGTQTDWSGGAGTPGPVAAWTTGFDAAVGISWRAVPGQLALAGNALAVGVKHTLAAGQNGAFGIVAADFDGDGDTDIVGAAEYGHTLTLWSNNGDSPPTFTAETLDGDYPGVSGVFAADLDGDLDLDLVACTGTRYSRITCYLNDGGSPAAWAAHNLETAWGESWEIAAGDVDGDGRVDVVGTFLTEGQVVWWRNDGAAPEGWVRQTVDASFGGAHSARIGDIDGDGLADIVGCGTTSNEVAWWRQVPGEPATWTKQVLSGVFFGARSVRLGDLDGDGDLDVAATGFNGRVAWWSNGGGSPVAWTQQTVDTSLVQNHQLQLADLNGDGWLDLLVASYGSNAVVWWENSGGPAPLAWTKRFADYQLPRPLATAVGDVDGDGDLEIIATSNTTGVFTWYEASTFAATGELTGSILDSGGAVPAAIDWTAETPVGTAVAVQVRTGATAGSLGPWSTPLTAPGALPGEPGAFCQYRITLSTSDPAVSPILRELSVRPSAAAVPGTGHGAGLTIYPNPANPRTLVAFELPERGPARIDIYDARGRLVRALADTVLASGRHEVAWDGTDTRGRLVATGTYQVRLRTADGTRQSRVTLVR